jgi:hypothetical protein
MEDQTARILAERGTRAQQAEYAVYQADHAYAAATDAADGADGGSMGSRMAARDAAWYARRDALRTIVAELPLADSEPLWLRRARAMAGADSPVWVQVTRS